MTEEFSRFMVLFNEMANYTEAWLDKMAPEKMDWVPIENSSMRFGDRVLRITTKGLVIHLCVGERHWIEQIHQCEHGAQISIPKRPEVEQQMNDGDFREVARALHRENMDLLRAYTGADLNKTVVFAGRQWTGMGLLWGMYAHRAFHLGNIDIYVRQSDAEAPDFFKFFSEKMA